MPSFHLLRRLQRHGVPGRAVAVPVDRAAVTRSELAGLFGVLEPVVQQCRLRMEEATTDAGRTLETARVRARRTVDDARTRAASTAAAVAAEELARIEDQAAARLAAAVAEAARVEATAAGREERLRARIVSYTMSIPGPDSRVV